MTNPVPNPQISKLDYYTQSWLHKLSRQADISPLPVLGRPDRIIHYKVDIDGEKGSLAISACAVKFKKNGEPSRSAPRSTSFSDIMTIMEAYGEDVQDWRVIQALLASGQSLYTSCIRTSLPINALRAIVQTQRCFVMESDCSAKPLEWGPEQPGGMEWEFLPDGAQRPRFFCADDPTGKEIIVLDTSPYAYYSKKAGVIGPVSFSMPDKMVRVFRDAPRISITEAPTVQKFLAEKLPPSVPPMKDLTPKEIRGALPKPCLTLSVEARTIQGRYYVERVTLPIAKVSYLYDGIPVGADNPQYGAVQVAHKGSLYKVMRSVDAETKAETYLDKKTRKQTDWRPVQKKEFYYANLKGGLDVAAADAYECLVPSLMEKGWNIVLHPSYPYRPVEGIGDWYANIESTGIDWFDVDVGVMIQGEKVNVLPFLLKALKRMGPEGIDEFLKKGAQDLKIDIDKGILKVPADVLQRVLGTLVELYDQDPLTEDGKLRFSKWQLAMMHELTKADAATQLRWMGTTEIQSLASRLANRQAEPVTVPKTLKCSLRPYQQEGVNWLQFLRSNEMAGILADDMGLGKTVQALAHIMTEKAAGRLTKPVLVVAPTSLMVNWRLEAQKFAPSLKVLVLQGLQRKQSFSLIQEHDVILTTYPLLARDKEILLEHEYYLLILDEAQVAKNANTIAYKVLQQIKASHRICLTGTPMENHLGELWSLFNFLMPGFLGDARRFGTVFRHPIEKQGDDSRRQWLSRRLSPFVMRRTKEEVATELPQKTVIVQTIDLGEKQKQLYEAIRLAMHAKVQAEIENKGLKRSHIVILDALLKMRQVCCDPRLLSLKTAQETKESAKFDVLMQLLPEMIEEKRQILLFSQFTSMLALIEEGLKERDIPYVTLTGQTRDRATPIEMFQAGKVPLFLISLKAGGTGLNLTAADTVIHYDPWWNPAAENQATDRAHRIGQTKPVFVYKLVTTGTIEEKIIGLQQKKAALLAGLFDEAKADKVKLSEADITSLFAPLEKV